MTNIDTDKALERHQKAREKMAPHERDEILGAYKNTRDALKIAGKYSNKLSYGVLMHSDSLNVMGQCVNILKKICSNEKPEKGQPNSKTYEESTAYKTQLENNIKELVPEIESIGKSIKRTVKAFAKLNILNPEEELHNKVDTAIIQPTIDFLEKFKSGKETLEERSHNDFNSESALKDLKVAKAAYLRQFDYSITK